MSSGYTIHVSGISPSTSEDKLSSFFSFCGTISSLTKPTPSTAEIAFAKESAAKTALMLNGGTLDGAHLEVQGASAAVGGATSVAGSLPAGATGATPIGATSSSNGNDHVGQEDKPAAGIIAEYLAHGYVLSDAIVQRAIELDRQRGISSRFLTYINKLDAQVGAKLADATGHSPVVPVSASHGDAPAIDSKGETIGAPTPVAATTESTTPPVVVSGAATEGVKAHHFVAAPVVQAGQQVKALDAKHGISSRFNDYYSKAINTEAGQHILRFYTTTSKQVQDVHQEAKRIAEQKKATGNSPFAGVAPASSSSATAEKPATVL